jgi:hypothetical protein
MDDPHVEYGGGGVSLVSVEVWPKLLGNEYADEASSMVAVAVTVALLLPVLLDWTGGASNACLSLSYAILKEPVLVGRALFSRVFSWMLIGRAVYRGRGTTGVYPTSTESYRGGC